MGFEGIRIRFRSGIPLPTLVSSYRRFSQDARFIQSCYSASDPINDLDWTATPDNQSILAIGFAHRIDILCQQRMTYFDETPGWGICWTIDISGYVWGCGSFMLFKLERWITHKDVVLLSMIPHPISDSIWLARGSLLVGTGHMMFLFGQCKPQVLDNTQDENLFEHVARHNGPLDEYHPQMLLQCLLWGAFSSNRRTCLS